MGRHLKQPSGQTLRGPQVGPPWRAHWLLQSVGMVESLQGALALLGGTRAQRLRRADQQRLSRSLWRVGHAVSRTAPLSGVGGRGVVWDKLGRLELGWSGGGRGLAQGGLAGTERGRAGGVRRKVGRSSNGAGTELTGSRVLPGQTGRLGDLQGAGFQIVVNN